MWSYQRGFRAQVEIQAKLLLTQTGFVGYPRVMLIGFPITGRERAGVCIEPEDDIYAPSDLATVPERAAELYEQHPDRGTYYGDAVSRDEILAQLRDDMRAIAIKEALERHPGSAGRTFFVSRSAPHDDHEVHIIVSVDSTALDAVPRLSFPADPRSPLVPSIIDAIILELLDDRRWELHIPNAGHVGVGRFDYDAPDILLRAVRRMVGTTLRIAGHYYGSQTVLQVQGFASLLYEGRSNAGRLIIAPDNDPAVTVEVRFPKPVSLSDRRHVRKLLESSGRDVAVLMNAREVYGLGTVASDYDPTRETIFQIIVGRSGTWRLAHASMDLVLIEDTLPKLPMPMLDIAELRDTIVRTLTDPDIGTLEELAIAAGRHRHGAMLIISDEAAAEAARLAPQAMCAEPGRLSPRALEDLTNMDGGVLIDPQGRCHATGVILDGTADQNGDPSRGSRYNNGIRYLGSGKRAVMLCYSSDGDTTILPALKKRRRRSEIDALVERYLDACAESPPRLWVADDAAKRIDDIRFYLSDVQCARINQARADLNTWRRANGETEHGEPHLTPDPELSDDCWLPEEDQ